jgi:hypothetical protein
LVSTRGESLEGGVVPSLDPGTRDEILALLEDGEATSAEIGRLTGVPRQAVAAVKAHITRAKERALRQATRDEAKRRADKTARWARIMTKWQITRSTRRRGWEVLNFTGPRGGESRGVVDLMAIRKDHRGVVGPRGDFFEILLIQVKGGTSGRPTEEDIVRLQRVKKRYGAREVVLAEWRKGRAPQFYRLTRQRALSAAWERVADSSTLFV